MFHNTLPPNLTGNSLHKKDWRSFARQSRAALFAQADHFAHICQRVQQNLLHSELWQKSDRILLYASFQDEVDTRLLLQTAWEQKKNLYLPRCAPGKRGEMTMHASTPNSQLVRSPMGILEPVASATRFVPDNEQATLVVVPGLLFDQQGYRIGYGGGYYDRLLAHSGLRSVGLIFSQSVVPLLPHEPWDMPVAAICTEDGLVSLGATTAM